MQEAKGTKKKSGNNEIDQYQQITEQQLYLQYYHVQSLDQLIDIMIHPFKSDAYKKIRNQSVEQVGAPTLKESYRYKKQLLANTLNNFHTLQTAPKKKKQKQAPRKQISKFITGTNRQALALSEHSYQELLNFFQTEKYNKELCKKVLLLKYRNFDVLKTHRYRKKVWLSLLNIDLKYEDFPDFYQTLVNLSQSNRYKDYFDKVIHADVIRTIHENDTQYQEAIIAKMENILFCFARRNPYIGYCQGMNFILNFILTMQFEEQQCYWLLVSILQQITPFTYYTNMSGVAADILIIGEILKILEPKIAKKLQDLQIDVSIFMLEWLVCLYTSTLPFYLLVIVWDLLIMEGSVVLLKTAVVLVRYFRDLIEESTQFAQFFTNLEMAKKKIALDEQAFLQMMNQVHIDSQILQIVRKFVSLQKSSEKEQIRKALNSEQKQNWKQVQCNIEWPICFQQLKKQKLLDEDVQVWVFKDQNGPRLISDYFPLKVKKASQANHKNEDFRDPEKKIIIGRIPHICDISSYVQKQYFNSRGIQLDQLDLGVRRINKNLQGILSMKISSSAEFYRRATMNKIAFASTIAKFSKYTKKQ